MLGMVMLAVVVVVVVLAPLPRFLCTALMIFRSFGGWYLSRLSRRTHGRLCRPARKSPQVARTSLEEIAGVVSRPNWQCPRP